MDVSACARSDEFVAALPSNVGAAADGHVTPLVAVRFDDAIHFATGAAEQKAVNLRTNQNVILTTGCNEWEQGLDVVVEGEAVQVIDESILKQLAEAWAAKWDGRWSSAALVDGPGEGRGSVRPADGSSEPPLAHNERPPASVWTPRTD